MSKKDQILQLRSEGKTYRQIEKISGCCRSLIAYYVNSTTKAKSLKLQSTNRYAIRTQLKQEAGAKCQICGYDRCLSALEFHHRIPDEKSFSISDSMWSKGTGTLAVEKIREEIKKCVLICSNCHREVHEGITELPKNGCGTQESH